MYICIYTYTQTHIIHNIHTIHNMNTDVGFFLIATDQEGAELQLLLDVGKCLLLRCRTFSL